MAQLYRAVPCLAGPWFAMPWLGLPCLLLQQSAVTSPNRVCFAVTHGIQECRGNCTFHEESQAVQFPSQRRFCEQKKKRKVGLPPFQLGIQTRDRFPSLLQNVVLGSFKSFRPIGSPSYYNPLSHIAHCTPLCWDIGLLDTWTRISHVWHSSNVQVKLLMNTFLLTLTLCRNNQIMWQLRHQLQVTIVQIYVQEEPAASCRWTV